MRETKLLGALETATRRCEHENVARILVALDYKRAGDPAHVATLSALAHEYYFASISEDGRRIVDAEAYAHAERLFGHLRQY